MPEACDSSPVAPPAAPVKRRRFRRTVSLLFRAVRNLLALAMLVQVVMVLAPVPERLYKWLSVAEPSPGKADFIVCLGGGYGREAIAAQLWHQKVAPFVIVSNAPGAAEYMRYLVSLSGVPRDRILLDRESYTTGEHPAGVARMPGVDRDRSRLVIVTDHTHTRRAKACFVKGRYANITMYAAKERPPETYWDRVRWRIMVIPAITYESAALAQYWWQGKI